MGGGCPSGGSGGKCRERATGRVGLPTICTGWVSAGMPSVSATVPRLPGDCCEVSAALLPPAVRVSGWHHPGSGCHHPGFIRRILRFPAVTETAHGNGANFNFRVRSGVLIPSGGRKWLKNDLWRFRVPVSLFLPVIPSPVCRIAGFLRERGQIPTFSPLRVYGYASGLFSLIRA